MRNREEARRKAEELVSRMTLEEKASQLRYDAPAIERLGIPAYNWWNEALHGVARAGTATVFPQAIGLAAMFDEEMQEKIASVISTEARAKYNGQSAHGDRDIYKGPKTSLEYSFSKYLVNKEISTSGLFNISYKESPEVNFFVFNETR